MITKDRNGTEEKEKREKRIEKRERNIMKTHIALLLAEVISLAEKSAGITAKRRI